MTGIEGRRKIRERESGAVGPIGCVACREAETCKEAGACRAEAVGFQV
jgi:hypothetical protein